MTKILVIRLSSLGDIVLTLPVFVALRKAYPQASITALVKEQFADLLSNNPDINQVMTLKRQESIGSIIRRVRQEHFDIVVDLHANLRSTLISAFSQAPRRVRYQKAALARRLFVKWRLRSSELERHTLDRYMQTIEPLLLPASGNILIIQTAFLGDAVLTTPLLDTLKEHEPAAQISVLCTPETAEIFKHHPAVAHIIVFDKRNQERSLLARWKLIQRLKEKNFSLAVIPHRSFSSALIARLAQIPRRVGFSSSQGQWLMTDTVPFRWGTHDVERNLTLLGSLGIHQPTAPLHLSPDPKVSATVLERLRAAGLGPHQKLIGINAGSVWATKRWLPEGFAAVADRMAMELKTQVLFIGGGKDRELNDKILGLMKTRAINWAGQTTLSELLAAIAQCSVFLTNDSGPMHIAVACQVPTVALFGPTTKELGFFPYGSGHTVIEKNLTCRPCGLHGADACPLGHFECMKTISADEVFQAVKEKLMTGSTSDTVRAAL
jgi:heptosyltransferase-2